MTEAQTSKFLDACIQDIRIGAFIKVARDRAALKKLGEAARLSNPLGAQASAILAETNDQVSRYQTAHQYANYDVGKKQLQYLADAIRTGKKRNVVRAHAWLLLQCGVSEFRREGGHLRARDLISKGIELISANKGGKQALDSQHIESLYFFWRGRINSAALFDFREADKDFERALDVAKETLETKLTEADRKRPKEREGFRHQHLASGAYLLATYLGFGLAQSRQYESRLADSVWFLRATIPLSLSSNDAHRRGFQLLLMATALRGLARIKPVDGVNQLAAVRTELDTAMRDLTQPISHSFHLARLHHQIALCCYNSIPPAQFSPRAALRPEMPPDKVSAYLREAQANNEKAATLLANKEFDGFRDPMLDYGIRVVRSLIQTATGKWLDGLYSAREAQKSLGRDVPGGTHGWGLIATGMAWAAGVDEDKGGMRAEDAERELKAAIEDRDVRPTDKAAAHLHLARMYDRTSSSFNARIHFAEAEKLITNATHSTHGWLQDFRDSVKVDLGGQTGPDLHLNVAELLERAINNRGEGGAWAYLKEQVDLDLRSRLLGLEECQTILRSSDGEGKLAHKLGLARATIFNWKNVDKLKEYFPTPRGKRIGKSS